METIRTYVLGVDPGTTTGLAVDLYNEVDPPTAVWSRQLPWDEATDELARRLEELRTIREAQPGTAVLAVGERFMVTSKTAQRGQSYCEDAMGMLGVLRREARLTGVELAPLQQSSSVMTLVGDGALRTLGIYAPGATHVNDAHRHTVACALKRKLMPARHMLGVRR